MTVVSITAPAAIVDLQSAKAHLRLETTEHDGLVAGLIAAAQQWLDGPGGWLGRAVGLQTLELRDDYLVGDRNGDIDLPYPPLVSITSIKYLDSTGTEITLSSSVYAITTRGLSLAYSQSWPSARGDRQRVKIRYVAGYTVVPEPIKQAVLMLVAHWWANREAASPTAMTEPPFAVEALLSPYRVWSL